MSRPSPNLAVGLLDLFVAPGSLFRALPDRRGWGWAAFALIVVAMAAAMYAFLSPMSPEWIVEQQIQQMGEKVSDQDIARMRPQLEMMAPHTATFSALGGAVMTGVLIVVFGSIYALLARFAGPGPRRRWSQWLRLVTWTQLPQVAFALGLIALAVFAGDPDQPMGLMGYASLNQLVLGLPPGHRWYNLALNLNLFYLWSLVLTAIGIRTWTDASWTRAVAIAAAPWLLMFGVWAALA